MPRSRPEEIVNHAERVYCLFLFHRYYNWTSFSCGSIPGACIQFTQYDNILNTTKNCYRELYFKPSTWKRIRVCKQPQTKMEKNHKKDLSWSYDNQKWTISCMHVSCISLAPLSLSVWSPSSHPTLRFILTMLGLSRIVGV